MLQNKKVFLKNLQKHLVQCCLFVCFIQLEEKVEWLTRVKTLTTPVSAVVSLSDSIVCLSQ